MSKKTEETPMDRLAIAQAISTKLAELHERRMKPDEAQARYQKILTGDVSLLKPEHDSLNREMFLALGLSEQAIAADIKALEELADAAAQVAQLRKEDEDAQAGLDDLKARKADLHPDAFRREELQYLQTISGAQLKGGDALRALNILKARYPRLAGASETSAETAPVEQSPPKIGRKHQHVQHEGGQLERASGWSGPQVEPTFSR